MPELVEVLRRIRRPARSHAQGEVCEVCAVLIPEDHRHVVDLDSRSLKCCCQACSLLFTNDGAAGGRWRTVPRDVYALPDAMPAAEWERLQIPVGVAFMFRRSDAEGVSAFYPGPAGATESLLPLGAFEDIVARHPALEGLRPDVEALLVRIDREANDVFIAPIDVCYELVGLLRETWRGFDGGSEARSRLTGFFDDLRRRARPAVKAGAASRG